MRVGGRTRHADVRVATEHARDARGEDADGHDEDHGRRADEVRDRADDDDRQEARHGHEHVEHAEDAAADVLGQVLLQLRLRRDGDDPVGDPGHERDEHDDRQQRGDRGQVDEVVGPVGALEELAQLAGHRQEREHHAERDQPALDDPSARQVLAVRVEQQDAHHDADTERQHDDREVLRLQAERLSAKSGPRTPSTPTSEAVMPRYSSDQLIV